MKARLKKFRIFTVTKFGSGFFYIKAKDFQDAHRRLSKRDKERFLSITDLETDEEITKKDLLK